MKKCPFCQSNIPDESKFCLHCFSAVEKFDDEAVVPPKAKSKSTQKSKANVKSKLELMSKPKSKKAKSQQVMSLVSAIVLLTVTASCIVAVKKSPNKIPTDSEVVTVLQPVTKENGEQVTQEDGEPVFEVVIVESTTEKKGIIASLFGKDDSTTNKADSTENTTEKQGFFDKLFGKDDDKDKDKEEDVNTTESSTDNTSEDEPTATTNDDNGNDETTSMTTSMTPSTTPSTTTTTTTTAPTTTEKLTYTIDDFEYDEYIGYIRILKYTGNASTVVIPARIDGKRVEYFGQYAISDNPSIKKIIFEDEGQTFFATEFIFHNLPNLKEVVFPTNGFLNVSQYHYLFRDTCPNVESVTFGTQSKSGYHLVVDGAVYNTSGTQLYFYPPGKQDTSFTMLDTCQTMFDAFYGNKYLKTITLGKSLNEVCCKNYVFYGCTSLTNIYVDSNNTSKNIYSIDGILYFANKNDDPYTVLYPYAKKNTSYTFPDAPDGKNLYFIEYSFNGNPYIKEFKVPMHTNFNDGYYKNKKFGAPNLTKIYLKDCDNSYDVYTKTFKSRKDITIEYY